MLSRGRSFYTVIDAAAVPPRKRRGFVDISITRWAPFPDPEWHVEWTGDRAMVWAWSKSRLLEGEDGERRARPWRVLPESLLRGQPQVDGEVLVAMDVGVEARVWRDHVLLASQWWEEIPDLADWNGFRRGAGLPSAVALPLVEAPPLAAEPWNRRRSRAIGDVAQEYRAHLGALLVAIAFAAICLPLGAIIKLRVATYQVERDILGQDVKLKRILAARDATARAVDEINSLLALRPPAGQIRLLAEVTSLVPAGAGELLEWRMPDASNLEVTLKMSDPDPAGLVRAWEASDLFDEANVELGPNPQEVRIKARIVRTAAPGRVK